jgi:hypothetical protein
MRELESKSPGGLWMTLYLLDDMGFLEHGGILPGWITNDGKRMLKILSRCLE